MNEKFRQAARKLRNILSKPHVTILMGILLLFAGICEISETVIEEFLGFEVKTAHALIIFALSQIIVAFTHVVEGVESMGLVAVEEKLEDSIKAASKSDE